MEGDDVTAQAPAFTCRCIQQAERQTEGCRAEPWFCSEEGNHFDDYWKGWYNSNQTLQERVRFFHQLIEHYEAHALGAPHSHMGPLDQPLIGENCSCHDWNQMADPEHISEQEAVLRGIRWVNAPKSYERMIDGAE